MKRKAPSLRTKLAAVLRDRLVERDGQLVPDLSHEEAKAMTDDAVIARWEWDHVIHHAIGGSIHHSNLVARLREDHRAKTAKVDVPMIAKAKRVEASTAEFRRKMLAKSGAETPETKKKPKKKLQGRGFQAWRNMRGDIVKRKG